MSSPTSTGQKEAAPSQDTPISNPISPQRPPTYGLNGTKERRNPSITPRRFTRFFTPISQPTAGLSSARQALYDITAANRTQSSSQLPANPTGQENDAASFPKDLKRRKLLHTPESSEDDEQPRKRRNADISFSTEVDRDGHTETNYMPSSPCARIPSGKRCSGTEEGKEEERPLSRSKPLKRIVTLDERGLSARLLQMGFGDATRSRRRHFSFPAGDWTSETASFYSRPEDAQEFMSTLRHARCIPFCTAGLNTNSLVAFGDEDGRVRLLETEKHGSVGFKDTFLSFEVHKNAIIDMALSEDDSLLATASGDQTARVVDMTTQTTISVLLNHTASLKQVRFQPGANNNSVVATSSRDGSIQMWDLRFKGGDVNPTLKIPAPVNETATCCYNAGSIWDAHRATYHTRQSQKLLSMDTPSHNESPGRIGDVSVTSISFLSPGQEHLLLTASEANTSIKLWDIRSLNNKRRLPSPISYTRQPQSHSKFRHFGINSLTLSTDGTRLYSLCKDNTVYTYSTSHLILGEAPELSTSHSSAVRAAPQRTAQEGLGPIYGYRHPQLHATSFYVKTSLRPAKDGKSELLAVGSSDGCAIIFPTDERYFPSSDDTTPQQERASTHTPSSSFSSQSSSSRPRPTLKRTGSGLFNSRIEDAIPISQNGTPLIRGHDREVGALTWTADGELVTTGDDLVVRCWREGFEKARSLRRDGEGEGKRWGCGWADVGEGWDDDDDDDD